MSEYSPLRDAFQDLNRLLIDKQQWDAKHELDKSNQGLQRMQIESQLHDASLQRTGLERKAMLDQQAMEPVAVNIYDYVPNSQYSQTKLFDTGDAGEKYAKALVPDVPDAFVDRATGVVRDGNGEIIKRPRSLVATRAASVYGIAAGAFDPTEMINGNIQSASEKVAELQSALKNIKPTDIARRSEILQKLSEAKTTLNEHMGMLEPEKLIPFYQKKVEVLDNMSINAAANGVELPVLAQLQHAAQRANADLLHVRSELSKKEQAELNRQNKLEERRLTLEAARVRGETSKVKSEQKYIVNDADGKMSVYNVPKETNAVVQPPSGTHFANEDEVKARLAKGGDKGAKDSELFRISQELWSTDVTNVDNPLAPVKKLIVPADIPRRDAAIDLMGRFKDKFPNSLAGASRAQKMVIGAEKEFWKDVDVQLDTIAAKIGTTKDKLTDAQRNSVIEILAKGREFDVDFGYIPKWEHRKSLDRAYPGVIGLPPEEEMDEE